MFQSHRILYSKKAVFNKLPALLKKHKSFVSTAAMKRRLLLCFLQVLLHGQNLKAM